MGAVDTDDDAAGFERGENGGEGVDEGGAGGDMVDEGEASLRGDGGEDAVKDLFR